MPIYQTGRYRVKPSAVEKVKQAIKVFVRYVQEKEPGTKMYLAWQEKDDPTRFNHLFHFVTSLLRFSGNSVGSAGG